MKTIAERLAHARETVAKMSQEDLAQKAGVSQGTIGNIESGLRKNPRELLAIAKAAGVHAEWLKTGKGPKLLGEAPVEAEPALSLEDQALLRDMQDAMRSPRLAQKLAELRADVAELREFARNVYSTEPITAEEQQQAAGKPPKREQLLNPQDVIPQSRRFRQS